MIEQCSIEWKRAILLHTPAVDKPFRWKQTKETYLIRQKKRHQWNPVRIGCQLDADWSRVLSSEKWTVPLTTFVELSNWFVFLYYSMWTMNKVSGCALTQKRRQHNKPNKKWHKLFRLYVPAQQLYASKALWHCASTYCLVLLLSPVYLSKAQTHTHRYSEQEQTN